MQENKMNKVQMGLVTRIIDHIVELYIKENVKQIEEDFGLSIIGCGTQLTLDYKSNLKLVTLYQEKELLASSTLLCTPTYGDVVKFVCKYITDNLHILEEDILDAVDIIKYSLLKKDLNGPIYKGSLAQSVEIGKFKYECRVWHSLGELAVSIDFTFKNWAYANIFKTRAICKKADAAEKLVEILTELKDYKWNEKL